MKRKVIITGSSGFIGRSLVPYLLQRGYDVIALDKTVDNAPEFEAGHQCNLLDRERLIHLFTEIRPDAVIHLAARTDLDEKVNIEGYDVNINGVRNLIDAVKAAGTVNRVLFTSSQLVCKVGYIPRFEEDYRPNTLYGESKVRGEQIVRNSDLHGITWCILRPTTIWGEGMSPHYQRLLQALKRGRYFHVGRAPLFKSYGYVGNAIYQYAKFLEAASEHIDGRTFYIADYAPLSLREWTTMLAGTLGGRRIITLPKSVSTLIAKAGDGLNALGIKRFPFNSFRLNNILTEYQFDMSETKKICGPLPFSMQDGVKRTARWFLGKT
ncbi:NAD(P)-dependent oxidoreductase [Rhizobium sophorae]|uniref:NAD(P)-dependent oxidoreductase n=1 Tax=Rhizobium sophorae TaxID=1535242 RepID=A0A7Y3WFP4_9HYPH|nr:MULTISPECIES: NAD(P)-dependent oxidoreductase [Rhizobium]MBY3328824.1 NAD(P)-dependent oxidoreductase [Rhizobium laguerreae]MBY3397592.1 NAD(P)-dependent oxidoreductase [Rhizobium laguerreae]MBY5664645.1 NAD(P)-dependent oxidoreductase [Rhizobium leguminosarum]MBY5677895.1 NAD(P)-dependent oxidoreductase [Rhizobium leguminosarum]MCW1751901.1 NAD(P)-dependent oxidoreductase [Rhizobium acaciae]